MRSPRLLFAMVVLGTVAAGGAGAAVDAAPKPVCGGGVSHIDQHWQAIHPPFSTGSLHVTQVVSTAYVPDRMFATNGAEVMRTDDAGCTWQPALIASGGTLGVLPQPVDGILHIPTTAQITSIAAPSSATATGWVYVGWNDTSAVTVRPHVSVFDGKTWHQSGGLPNFGSIGELASVDFLPTSVYAVIDPATGLSSDGGLYASGNGGSSFSQRNPGVRSTTVTDLQTDPGVNTLLYALGANGMQVSHDGGLNFGPGTRPGADVDSFDVTASGGGAWLVQGHSSAKRFDLSVDGGLAWYPVPTRVAAKEVAIQPVLDQVAVSDHSSLWLQDKTGSKSARNATPTTGGPPTQLQFTAPSSSGYALVGVRNGAVLRAVFDLSGVLLQSPSLRPIRLLPQVLPHHFPSTLTPGRSIARLAPGAHKDVTYRLLLPRTPSPIDVMFLVDTSSSTEQTIQGLKQDLGSVINDLSTVGLDVDFGLADFRDYSSGRGNGNGELHDYPYRLDRRIGRVDATLRAALSRLRAAGGGDPPESQLTALYQSATGAGQKFHKHVLIPSGLDAGFRSNALRLAVLATDSRFHDEPYYLTPSWGKTVAALEAHDIHPIGLAVQTITEQDQLQGFRSLQPERKLTSLTGSLAPRGGVDCNGDLLPDLAAGDPFVCKVPVVITRQVDAGPIQTKPHVQPVKLAPAIATAAAALPDLRTVGLQFNGPAGIARVLAPSPLPRVDLKSDNTIKFTVRYTCPKLHKPHAYHLGVNANDGARVLATSAATVTCGAVPVPVPQHVLPPAAAVVVAAPVAAAPAPPAPGNPVPNANPNPNPALNANVGFVGQEEEQRQLAFAGADTGVEEEASTEMAMSRLGGGAALLLAGAAGYAARRRFAAAWHRR